MKIAFLDIYSGRIFRGAEVFTHNLATRLSKHNEIVVFQTGKKQSESYSTFAISGIPLLSHQGHYHWAIKWVVPYLYSIYVFIFTLKCLPALCTGKFDWIIPINGGVQVLLCRLIRNIRGGHVLISGHAGIGRDDYWNLIIGSPDVFVALTPAAYEWAKLITSRLHICYIPNGVDDTVFSPNGEKASLPLRPPVVLCVSALVSYKRVNTLIDAVAHLPHTSLFLIGDGPLRDQIKLQGKEMLGSRFFHVPYVPHGDMPSYYRAATVFSLPSMKNEAFGLVYLEALSCNLPVVAPDDEQRRKIIGHAGEYCDVEQADAYAAALQRGIEKDFGDNPRKQVQQYTWAHIAKEYEEILNRICT